MSSKSLSGVSITRRLAFDAGHRIPDHGSVCRSVHGHRYTLELTLTGPVSQRPGQADSGMVLDFADVKRIAHERIIDRWDHAFLVYEHDQPLRGFLESLPGNRTVVLDRVPTAENLATIIFELLAPAYQQVFGDSLSLSKVVLYETPNCWAEVQDNGV